MSNDPQYAQVIEVLDPRPDYLMAVNRAWQRGLRLHYQLFPTSVRDALPVVPVPLRQDETEVSLDLQYAFRHAYEGGPYTRGAVDYSQPCDPPLGETDAAWAAEQIVRAGRGGSAPTS